MMKSYADYEQAMHQALWSWADRHHRGELDGGKRQGRPPVLANRFAPKGVLVPPIGSRANDIRAAIPRNQRHQWFRSLKSSQALTQSVFGAIRAFDRLDLLQNVSTECGRPAFIEDHRGTTLDFEHEVRCLGEPRPTSIDVLLRGPQKRVAIECKLTEHEFGRCSRPQLRPDDTIDGPVVDQARGMALHADPCNTQGGADPCNTQGGADPCNTQGGADPCNTQGGADPCNTQGGADPCNTQGGADPCNTQGGADPSQGRIAYGGWVLKVFEASRGQKLQALRALPDNGQCQRSPAAQGAAAQGRMSKM